MTALTINDEDLTSLKGKVVIITGGSSGIGLATVQLLLSLGAIVVAGDLNEPSIKDSNLTFVTTNVTSWSDLTKIFKTAKQEHGRIDHVFANAGISGRTMYIDEQLDSNGDLLEPTSACYDVNFKGCINTVALAVHHMRRQDPPGGSVVITASASSYQRFRMVDYTVSKHAVLGLMRGLYPILSPSIPVRVNCISPSWTLTGLVPEGFVESLTGRGTQKPSVVARSVALLMADENRHGQMIYSEEGKYREIEESIFVPACTQVVGEQGDDIVAAKIIEAMASGNGVNPLMAPKS